MKKKIFSILLFISMCVLFASFGMSSASNVTTTSVSKSVGTFKYEIDNANKTVTLVSFSETWDQTKSEITADDINFAGYSSVSNYSDWDFVIGKRGLYVYPGMSGYPSAIKKITLPECVTKISNYAFQGSTNVTTITLPSTLKYIGQYAFSGCTGLTDVTMPNSVDTIDYYAFDGCSSLRSITLPVTVQTAESPIFKNCTNLSSIYYPGDLNAYISSPYASISSNNYHLYLNGLNLKELTIPDNLHSIPAGKFYCCSGIQKVTIPSSIKSIGAGAFYNCTNLTEVSLAEGLKTIDSNAFGSCSKLTSIRIPSTVTTLSNAFNNCKALAEINVSGGLNNDIQIGSGAFDGTAWISDAKNYENGLLYLDSHLVKADGAITACTITPNTKSIVGGAFENCTQLTEVSVPIGIKSIASSTFEGCSSLTKVILPATVSNIEARAFYKCSNLQECPLPSNVRQIGQSAFYGCSKLKTIVLPEGLEEISYYAFQNCGVTNITIPTSLVKIDSNAFYYNYSELSQVNISSLSSWLNIHFSNGNANPLSYTAALTLNGETVEDLVIPDAITEIKNYAFYGYDNLKSVVIHKNIEKVGISSFDACKNLTDVYFNGTAEEWRNVSVGTGNTNLTAAQMHYFSYVNIFDKNGAIVYNAKLDNGTFIDITELAGKVGHSIKLYVDETCSEEFDYEEIAVSGNIDLYLDYVVNQYTYKFVNYDGTVLKSATVDYGTTIVPPAAPEKPATEQYTYIFSGWNGYTEDMTQQAKEMVFTAMYSATVNQYSYYFVDEDGSILKEATVDYGAEIIAPEDPTKAGSAQYSYTFSGWDGFTEGMTQTAEELFFYATYTPSVNQYTYKFVDEDGTVLKEKTVNYNTMITAPTFPSKAATAQYTYTFSKWDGFTVGMKIKSDVTFTAVYNATVNQYTYKFLREDGSVVDQKTADYGTVIAAPDVVLEKPATEKYTYTHTGWEGFTEGMTLTEDIAFSPVFSSVINQYDYRFVDEDGTVLKEGTVDYGTVLTAPASPSKAATQQYTYTFSGWDGFSEGTTQKAETMVFTATYRTAVNQYTYTFKDENGTVLKTATVDYGTTIVAPENPTKAATDKYSYTFKTWVGFTDGMTITEDISFTAEYSATMNRYTYKFVDYDGRVVKSATVYYGTKITAPAAPAEHADQQYTYIFASWSGFVQNMTITKDIVFTARYSKILNQYTYLFVDENGNTIMEDYADYGTVIEAPEAPHKAATEKYTYVFAGWDGYTEGMILTDDTVFMPLYTAVINQYSYRFVDEDGSIIAENTVDYDSVIEAPADPEKSATQQYTYTFAGWDGYTEGITQKAETMVFTAKYNATVNQYTYTFKDEDGTVLKEVTADYGTSITAPQTPAKEATVQYSYTFDEWVGYTENMLLTDDVTFNATYLQALNQYTYQFIDKDGSVTKSETVDYGTLIALPETPTDKDPYTFDYWDGFVEGATVEGDVTYHAVYKLKQYIITIDEIGKDVTVTYGDNYVLPILEVQDFTFDGYYTMPNGEGAKLTDENGISLGGYEFAESIVAYPYYILNFVPTVSLDTTSGTLSTQFQISAATAVNGHYAVITKAYADGRNDVITTVPFDKWTDNGDFFEIPVTGIAAKELTDTFTVAIYDAEDALILSQVSSVADSILASMAQIEDPEALALYEAILEYGAAMQTYFGYGTDNLANKGLSPETSHLNDFRAQIDVVRNDSSRVVGVNPDVIYGSSCVMGDILQLKFYFTHNSNTILANGEDVPLYPALTEGYYYCTVDVAAEDIFASISIEVKDGERTLATATDSVASYCARLYNSGDETAQKMANAVILYGLAAKAANSN